MSGPSSGLRVCPFRCSQPSVEAVSCLGACCKSVNGSVERLLWRSIRPQCGPLRPLKARYPPFQRLLTAETVDLASRQTFSTGS